MYRQIRTRQICPFGVISLTSDNDMERSLSCPTEKISILEVDNIADMILETNRRIPKSKLPALVLGL